MDIVSLSGLNWLNLLIVIASGLLIGMSKVGIPGVYDCGTCSCFCFWG